MKMNMKNCQDYLLKISQYLDNDLPSEDVGDLENHLSTCRSCKRKFLELKLLTSSIKSIPREDMPPGLFFKVRKRIQERKEQKRSYFIRWGTVLSLSLLILLVFSSYYKPNFFETSQDSSQRLAQKNFGQEMKILTLEQTRKSYEVASLQEFSNILENLLLDFPEISMKKEIIDKNSTSYLLLASKQDSEKFLSDLEKRFNLLYPAATSPPQLSKDPGIIYIYIYEK